MTTGTRDLATAGLMLATWLILTLGIATTDWVLTASATPSLALAIALHLVNLRRRTRSDK